MSATHVWDRLTGAKRRCAADSVLEGLQLAWLESWSYAFSCVELSALHYHEEILLLLFRSRAAPFPPLLFVDTMLFKALRANKTAGEEQDASSSQTPQDRAKARRAQVRKAQVEHRQRKANYVKQLETEVARIRDMIAATQTETRLLQAENNEMRSRLAARTGNPQQSTAAHPGAAPGELSQDLDRSFSAQVQLDNTDGVTLNLGLDETMNLPVYQINSDPTSSSDAANTYPEPQDGPEDTEPPYCPFAQLTPKQTQQIINFILAYGTPVPPALSITSLTRFMTNTNSSQPRAHMLGPLQTIQLPARRRRAGRHRVRPHPHGQQSGTAHSARSRL